MILTRMIHLLVKASLILTGVILFEWSPLYLILPPKAPLPVPIKTSIPQKTPRIVPSHQTNANTLFPKTHERPYVPMPVVFKSYRVEFELEEGDIKTPPAPEQPPRTKPIAAGPANAKLPWVFALP